MAGELRFKRLSPTPDNVPRKPPSAPIRILGSGLSALTLACSLRKKRIPFKIYTRDSRPQGAWDRHDYSLLLPARIIRALRRLLCMSEDAFRHTLLVPFTTTFPSDSGGAVKMRVHRGKLEYLLRHGFEKEIEWECEIKVESEKSGLPRLIFPSHVDKLEGNITFDCMGAHSPIKYAEVSQTIFPIVLFRGKMFLSKSSWDRKFRHRFPNNTSQIREKFGQTILELIIDDVHPHTGEVMLSYMYSRPRLDGPIDSPDELWVPKRSTDEARSPVLIGKFLDEVKIFRQEHNLPEPYDEVFNPERMKEDDHVHWLQRFSRADQPKLIHLWTGDERIFKLGDAIFQMGVLETTGAEVAIEDGIKVAREIVQNGGAMLHRWLISGWVRRGWHGHASFHRMIERYRSRV
ncbi:5e3b3b21-df9e-4b8c-b503-f43dc38bd00c [Sclerotinia trifoliorum]|uniref:5e3b3b21-df9e-4b8c-b503-f43dc38bd00c n=1 Tax=Sclerotinia trifoliorum TaxID=28548 RepID=A0A8H2VNF2_9HELO|nr:5e3b3b21-df9e-4b8c-b503-f43dc38bd00c [Sclerotinia trifoliorum]